MNVKIRIIIEKIIEVEPNIETEVRVFEDIFETKEPNQAINKLINLIHER